MTFLVWQRGEKVSVASPRRVLRAAEVPVLSEAVSLCERLGHLHRGEHERIDEAERDAARQGFERGLAEGRCAARDELAAALLATSASVEGERSRWRREVAELALQVVRKMLGAMPEDELLAALADTAARDAIPDQPAVLLVHPDLCDDVRRHLEAREGGDASSASVAPRLEVRGDPACARATCRLETVHGSVDASLDEQLARLAQAWATSSSPDTDAAR